MSEPTSASEQHDAASDDELRQHTEAEAEGSDEGSDDGRQVPREHTQNPAEG